MSYLTFWRVRLYMHVLAKVGSWKYACIYTFCTFRSVYDAHIDVPVENTLVQGPAMYWRHLCFVPPMFASF